MEDPENPDTVNPSRFNVWLLRLPEQLRDQFDTLTICEGGKSLTYEEARWSARTLSKQCPEFIYLITPAGSVYGPDMEFGVIFNNARSELQQTLKELNAEPTD